MGKQVKMYAQKLLLKQIYETFKSKITCVQPMIFQIINIINIQTHLIIIMKLLVRFVLVWFIMSTIFGPVQTKKKSRKKKNFKSTNSTKLQDIKVQQNLEQEVILDSQKFNSQILEDVSQKLSSHHDQNFKVQKSEQKIGNQLQTENKHSSQQIEARQLLDQSVQLQIRQNQNQVSNIVSESLNLFFMSMQYLTRKFIKFLDDSKVFYKYINHMIPYKRKKVYYENNYASINGGAKIIMKGSTKIKSINSLLDDSIDKYMYTDDKLPIKFVIGLNQQIALESITIVSFQMYSSITKQFSVEGKFSMDDKKWVPLGLFVAENQFGPQQFFTQRKIVRYVRIKIRSVHGKWTYFTLTQVIIKGKGLFADALAQLTKYQEQNISISSDHENEHQDQQQEVKVNHFCENKFIADSQQPHESNLITSLIRKIDQLQDMNAGQSKVIESLEDNMNKMYLNFTRKKIELEQSNLRYRQQKNGLYYIVFINSFISCCTIISMLCFCMMRRKHYLEHHQQAEIQAKKKKNQ